MQVNGVTTKVEGFNLPIPVGILPVVIPDSLNIPEKILQNILLKLLVDSTQGTLFLGTQGIFRYRRLCNKPIAKHHFFAQKWLIRQLADKGSIVRQLVWLRFSIRRPKMAGWMGTVGHRF